MARGKGKNVAGDRAAAKAAKQKKLAIGLSVFLVAVLAYEVPHTMKMMNAKPAAVVVSSSAPAPPVVDTPSPTASSPVSTPAQAPSAPTLSGSSSTGLVAAVPVSADAGQLTEFTEFASKDPFSETVQKTVVTGSTSSPKSSPKTAATPKAPKAPPTPPPTSAVISLNGELMSVAVGTEFPISGTVFDEVGSPLFQLDALTQKTAKVSIAGGSYADGAPTLALVVGKPVTLQNTADGTRYTLVLEPQGTIVPAAGSTSASTGATPTTSGTPTTTTQAPPLLPPVSGSGG